jgi:hypothetical protein
MFRAAALERSGRTVRGVVGRASVGEEGRAIRREGRGRPRAGTGSPPGVETDGDFPPGFLAAGAASGGFRAVTSAGFPTTEGTSAGGGATGRWITGSGPAEGEGLVSGLRSPFEPALSSTVFPLPCRPEGLFRDQSEA